MSEVTAVPIAPARRRVLVLLWLAIVVAVSAGAWVAFAGTGKVVAERGDNAQFLAWNKKQAGVVEAPSGLQYRVLEKGDGAAHPTDADVALITYAGTLRNGTPFDANERPVPMPVAGSVPGFSEALKLMTKGAKYRLWIKPELAYGEQSPDPSRIPNGSLLVFDVKLLDFLPETVLRQMQAQQQMQQQGGTPGAPPPGAGAPQPQ